jgi:beta-lactamase regulating signal transducer with metallopeptidase domain
MHSVLTEGTLIIRSLGWTILHSLWQGALISGCLWLILKTINVAQARLKYHLSLAAMLLLAACFATTWIRQWQRLQSVVVYVTEKAGDSGVPTTHAVTAFPKTDGAELWMIHSFPQMEKIFPALVAIYALGILLMIVRFSMGITYTYRLRNRNIHLPAAEIQQLFLALKARLDIHATIKLFLSSTAQVPMVSGFLKPVILLPVTMATGLTTLQLEAILLHELAHIRRQDYLINILQTIVETILFFNPFLWWISAGIRREREHCCDDLVLAETLQPLPYATALAALEAHRYASQPLALAASGNNKHQLFNRIKRFTEMKRTPLSYGRLAAAIVTVCIIAGGVIWFTPAFAQHKKQPAATTSTTTKVQKIIVIDDQGNKKEYGSVDELPEEQQTKLHESMKDEVAGLDDGDDNQVSGINMKMNGLDTSFNEEQVSKLVGDAMKSVDWKAINKTTRMAMASAGDAMAMAGKQMKNIDWDKIDQQIDQSLSELDKIDWDAAAAHSQDGKTAREMRKEMQEEISAAKAEAREELSAAREEIREARLSRRDGRHLPVPPMPPVPPMASVPPMPPMPPMPPRNEYNKMLTEMDKDGLIERNQDFSIRKDSHDLYINGQAQPDYVKVKYRHYFTPGKVKIEGNKNRLSITSTNSKK